MIEIIIMCGVLWNATLQTYWFFWSRSIHNRKHFTDDIKDTKIQKTQKEINVDNTRD